MQNFWRFLVWCLCCTIFYNAYAQSFADFQGFKSYVEAYAHQALNGDDNMQISVMQLDPNMQVPQCDNLIQATLAEVTRDVPINTVVLQCDKPQSWVLYVPIRIGLMDDVLVAKRLIMPNEVITEDHVIKSRRDRNQLQDGFYLEEDAVVGLAAMRMIPAGHVLGRKNLKQLPLVKKNQLITLILKHGSIEIAMAGIAKSDGFLNDSIKIMNPSSKKLVDAVVTGADRVEMLIS